MKPLFIVLILIVTFMHAGEAKAHLHLPYGVTMGLIDTIRGNAIVIGEGEQEVHVFLDPLCPHSRKFITMVSGSPKMLAKYRYHIYLYSIPRLHSEKTVAAIYASEVPGETLLEVMVDGGRVDPASTAAGEKAIAAIAEIAHSIDVYKRPYIIVKKMR